MLSARFTKQRLSFYLIPIMIGMAGIMFAQQFENMTIRLMLVLVSVAVPVLAIGNLLARQPDTGREKYFLLVGVLFLIAGAATSVLGGAPTLIEQERITQDIANVSRLLGLASVCLGLGVVLYTVVRRGENVERMAERFWHLADHITEGMLLIAPNGEVTLVNDQFLNMFGLKATSIMGRSLDDFVEHLNLKGFKEHLDAMQRGDEDEFEIDIAVNNEERRFWFSMAPVQDETGRHTLTLATVRDVTEHYRLSKRVERYAEHLEELVEEKTRKLAESERQFRELLITMNEGFLTVDTNYRIRFTNDRICIMFEMDPGQLHGRSLFDFVELAGHDSLTDLLLTSETHGGSDSQQEINFLNTRGEVVPTMVAATRIFDHEGRPSGYSLVVTNIAQLRTMQDELVERARELSEANEELRMYGKAKDGFLSNVSHELRTPLSTIQGYVEMLESGQLGEVQPAQQNALQVMDRNVLRLKRLINEMIEFSRMEIRGIQLTYALFDPVRLAEECVASIVPETRLKHIKVTVRGPDEPIPPCWGDPEKLGQVLGILLNNAAKFTPEDGRIDVHVAGRDDKTLSIAVQDSGIGISPEFHEKIFGKFFQVDSSMTRRYEGTGIGLSIAKNIVAAHAGQLDLESEQGEGSMFTIVLPNAVFNTSFDEEVAADLPPMTVVVADKGKLMQPAAEKLLTVSGSAVHLSANEHYCLRVAETNPPDLVIVNDNENDLAGRATIELLRGNPLTMETPIIVLSSENKNRLKDIFERWEGVSVVGKPYTMQNLLNCISETVDELPIDFAPRSSSESQPEGSDLGELL